MKIVNDKAVSVFNFNLPTDCIGVIMDFAFDKIPNYKKKQIMKINKIIKQGYSRTRVYSHFYRVWNDADHDSFWMHAYVDKKHVLIQNENCVYCGNYRETKCKKILCLCDEFVELYEEL